MERSAKRGLVRVECSSASATTSPGRVGALGGALVTQVDLPLRDPGVDDAVERLSGLGFFFCGLLPELDAGDVLRLQRRRGERPRGCSPRRWRNEGARELLAYIDADRLSSTP